MGTVIAYRGERRTWEVRCWRHGRRIRRSFGDGEAGRVAAAEFAAAVDAELAAEARWLPSDGIVRADEALRGWLATYRPTLSRSYEQTARTLIERHLVPAFGGRSLRSLTEADALAFAERTLEAGRSAATVRNALSLFRAVAQKHVEAGILASNPFAGVGRLLSRIEGRESREVRRVDAYSLAELGDLLSLAERRKPWLFPVLSFLAYTGARRGEALGLRWPDVDFSRGLVTIRRARVRGVEKRPKNGKARQVPMDAASPRLRAVLLGLARRKFADPDGWVFLSPRGCMMHERNLSRGWEALRRVAVRQGVRPLRLHDLRHTFASHALAAGVPYVRVASWLGHSPEVLLRIYSHAVVEREETAGFLDRPQTVPNRPQDSQL